MALAPDPRPSVTPYVAEDPALVPQTLVAVPDLAADAPALAEPSAEASAPSDRHAKGAFRAMGLGMAISDALCLLTSLSFLSSGGHGHALDTLDLSGLTGIWVGLFAGARLYPSRGRRLSPPEELRRIFRVATVGILAIFVFVPSFESAAPLTLARGWAILIFLELASRRGWRWYISRQRDRGRLQARTLVIGTNDEAAHLGTMLRNSRLGFAPLGFVSVSDAPAASGCSPVLGPVASLPKLIRDLHADSLFVAGTAVDSQELARILKSSRDGELDVHVSANLPEIALSRLALRSVGSVVSFSVRPVRLSAPQVFAKRAFDVVGASLGLLLCLPLFPAIAIAIRLTSSGPVLFRQRRVTRGGRIFTIYKFRTMLEDRPDVTQQHSAELTRPFFKLRQDPRLTRVGRVLRRYSLDELPQLFNVLVGDLSLVGPRPLWVEQVAPNMELLESRHVVKAGLTGWWQINGRNNLGLEETLKLDLFYIENWSLAFDFYIAVKTVEAVLRRDGAY